LVNSLAKVLAGARRERDQLRASAGEKRVRRYEQGVCPRISDCGKRGVNFSRGARFEKERF
jgi:hypothetical protein